MREFLFGLAEVTLSMSAVIALLLLGGRAWSKRFAPRWRYLAWLVVALRLAVPFNLSLPKAPVTVEVPRAAAVQTTRAARPAPEAGGTTQHRPADAALPDTAGDAVGNEAAGGQWPPLQTVLLGIWAAGAGAFLAAQFGGYAALWRKLRRWGREGGTYEGLRVLSCPKVDSPMLVGFFRPVIVLPEGMEGVAREFALLHELTHHRRHDLWYKLLLVWCNALHWFNPLVWVLRREAAGDVELSCDAALLRGRDEDYRRAYGTALVSQAAGRTPGAALTSAFSGSKGSLKTRVLALLDMAPKRPGRAALAAVCLLALMAGTLVACRGADETRDVVIYSLSFGEDDLEKPAEKLYFLDLADYDEASRTGHYYEYGLYDFPTLAELPVAADAAYTGFPSTMPNSSVESHPSAVLWLKIISSSKFRTCIPARLTVRDGVVVELSPLEGCTAIPAERTEPAESTPEPAALADGSYWARSGTYDAERRTVSFTPVEVDREAGTYRETRTLSVTVPVAEDFFYVTTQPMMREGNTPVTLPLERFFGNQPQAGSEGESLLELTVTDGAVTEGRWASAFRMADFPDGTYRLGIYGLSASSSSLSGVLPDGFDEERGVYYFDQSSEARATAFPVVTSAAYVDFNFPTEWADKSPGTALFMQWALSSKGPPSMFLTIEVKDGAIVRLSPATDCVERRTELGYLTSYEADTGRLWYVMGYPRQDGSVQVGGQTVELIQADTQLLDADGKAWTKSTEAYFKAFTLSVMELTWYGQDLTCRARSGLSTDSVTMNATVYAVDRDHMTLCYGEERTATPISSTVCSVALLNEEGNYAGAWGLKELEQRLAERGSLPCTLRFSLGEVTEIMEKNK